MSKTLRPASNCSPDGRRQAGWRSRRAAVSALGRALRPVQGREHRLGRRVKRKQRDDVGAERRNDAEFQGVARQRAPVLVHRLELERNNRDRIRPRRGELDLDRLGGKRGSSFAPPKRQTSLAPAGGASAPARRTSTLKIFPGRDRGPRRARNDKPGRLQRREPQGEVARTVLDVHKAVRFPLDVVELGDHVSAISPAPSAKFRSDILARAPAIAARR